MPDHVRDELKVIQASILDIKVGMIAHQVNCVGVMGKGLALMIAKKYPQVKDAYLSYPHWEPGDVQYVNISKDLVIANMAGQKYIGEHKRQTDFDALVTCLRNVSFYSKIKDIPLYLPYRLGSGLAGGATQEERAETWEIVQKIIIQNAPNAIICQINLDKREK